jgi:hypothetical protein
VWKSEIRNDKINIDGAVLDGEIKIQTYELFPIAPTKDAVAIP